MILRVSFHKPLLLCATLFWTISSLAQSPLHGFAEKMEQLTFGSKEAIHELERGWFEREIGREIASRTLLLQRCPLRREIIYSLKFDEYLNALVRRLRAQGDFEIDPLNVRGRLTIAIMANRMTDDRVNLVKEINDNPLYGRMLHWIGAQRALNILAGGFEDVNTGMRQPWVAAQASRYLRSNPLWPLLAENLTASEEDVFQNVAVNNFGSRDAFDEFLYLDQIKSIAINLNRLMHSRDKLPTNLALLLKAYDQLDLLSSQVQSTLIVASGSTAKEMSICLRGDSSCVPAEWFDRSLARMKQWEEGQYLIGAAVLRDEFPSMCKTPD